MKKYSTQLPLVQVTGKKYIFSFVKAFLLAILFCGISSTVFAAVVVVPATGGTGICSSTAADAPGGGSYTTLGNIKIEEALVNDIGATGGGGGWTAFITLNAPTGWSFNTAAVPTFAFTSVAGTDITSVMSGGLTTTVLTVRVNGSTRTNLDTITIIGLQVRPNTSASASGFISGGGFNATGISGTTNFGNLSLNPTPIYGGNAVCIGGTLNLSDSTATGVWSSDNSTVATVTGGIVHPGTSAGTARIDYTVASCVTVNTVVVSNPPGTFSGVTSVCVGSTTTLSNNSVSTGTWTTTPTSIATVGSTTGVVGGVSANTAIITYSTSSACATATVAVTVNPLPAIGGPDTLCIGNNIIISDNPTGGVWSSSNSGVATINASTGQAFASSVGTSVMTYKLTSTTGCQKTTNVVVHAQPGTFSGNMSICTGTTTILSNNSTSAGTWTSGTVGVATIGATSGTAGGVSQGTSIITYHIAACPTATVALTVTQTPGTISGPTAVCQNTFIILSDPTPAGGGGVWSTGNSTIATVTSSVSGGTVTGGTGTGSVNITYSNGSCFKTYAMTVNQAAGNIAGTRTVCTGATTLLSDSPAGTWSSSASSVATITASGSGIVSGVTAGTTVITYTTTGGSCTATASVVVHQSPDNISGTMNVCATQVTTLSDDNPTGGTWSSSPITGSATVDASGNVTGASAGTVRITYTEPSFGCISVTTVTVNAIPSNIQGITTVCQASTTSLSDTSPGGTWSSDNSSVATIDAAGTAYGTTGGTANITYAFGPTCYATTTLTVNPLPDTGIISGSSSVCLAGTTQLSDGGDAGAWSVDNTLIATVSATGVVSGVALGNATVSYTVTNGCGTLTATFPITVLQYVPTVTISASANPACLGIADSFSATTTNGGTPPVFQWSVNGTVSSSADTFVYTPVDGDTVVCRLTSNAACLSTPIVYDTLVMTVNPVLIPAVSISSDLYGDTVCVGTNTRFTAVPVNGGTGPAYSWFAGSTFIGTTNPLMYVPNNGEVISCTMTSSYSCAVPAAAISNSVTMTVDITETPAVTITASSDPSCAGSPVTYTAHTLYGGIASFIRWTQNNINVATGPTYTTIPLDGDQVYCVLKSSQTCRTADSVFSNTINQEVDSPIVPIVQMIVSHTNIGVGMSDTLIVVVTPTTIVPTFQWYLNGVAIPGATRSFYIATSTAVGVNYYYCIVGNGNACNTQKISELVTIHVYGVGVSNVATGISDLQLVPNPNAGVFNIEGTVSGGSQNVTIEVTNAMGQVVYKNAAAVTGEKLNTQVSLGNELANGVYLLHVITNDTRKTIRFSLSR